MLADEMKRRVIVVDTSNEIGGDGIILHHCIGSARRMPVGTRFSYFECKPNFRSSDLIGLVIRPQHEVLIEAVQNHNPEV